MVANKMGYDSAEALVISLSNWDGAWVLDSGCTFHIIPYKDWFVDYKEVNGGIVHMRNNHPCNMIRVGLVKLRLNDGSTFIMKNMRHVLALKNNLISLGIVDNM